MSRDKEAMAMPDRSLSALQEVVGAKNFRDWLKWAQGFLDEFALHQLNGGFEALARKVGLAPVRSVYRKRLLNDVKQSPVRRVKALDTASGQTTEIQENPKLEQLTVEVLCLARLAELADAMELLVSTSKRPVPEAKARLAGCDCLVEVKHFEDLTTHSEEPILRAITDPRLSGQSARGDQLPAHAHLRAKLEGAWAKFKDSPHTVNLIFVCFLSVPEFGVSFVPALYGEGFLQVPFNPWEFQLPLPLGEDGLFANENWRVVSGVAGIWGQRHPPLPPWQEIRWSGVLFENPKAITHVPQEVALKLMDGFRMLPLGIVSALLPRKIKAGELYERYVRPLESRFWGRLVAVNGDGEILLGDDEVELTRKAIARFGKGNFVLFRVGPKAVVKL